MDFSRLLLQNFSQHLRTAGASNSTLKNYLADIQLFFRYLSSRDQYISLTTLPHLLSPISVATYRNYLHTTCSPATAKRRLSSFNKFLTFSLSAGLSLKPTPESPITLPNPSYRFKTYLPALFIILTVIIAIVAGAIAAYLLP